MQTLEAVIAEALTSDAMINALCDGGASSAEIIATAVRAFLGSEEVDRIIKEKADARDRR